MNTSAILWVLLAGFLCGATCQQCGEGSTVGSRCVINANCDPPSPVDYHCRNFADIGYKCVPFDACQLFRRRQSIDEQIEEAENAPCDSEDDICCSDENVYEEYLDDAGFTDDPDADFQDPACSKPNELCCPEDRIKTVPPIIEVGGDDGDNGVDDGNSDGGGPPPNVLCEERFEEGYDCHEISNCDENSIDQFAICKSPRSVGKPAGATNCCVKKVTVNPKRVPCEDYKDQNFECKKSSECTPSVFCPRFFIPSPSEELKNNAELASCPGNDEKCCHVSDFLEQEDCGSTDSDFTCVSNSECMDGAFPDLYSAKAGFGYCPGSNDVCCKNKKPEEEVKASCEGRGYKCRKLPLAKLTTPVYKASSAPLFDIQGETNCNASVVRINNDINLCDAQDEVCSKGQRPDREDNCFNKDGTPIIPTPKDCLGFQSVCGRHNPDGLGLTAESPQDGEESTQFGEWPFTCLIYGKDDSLLGGATLIAPGVALTAVHNLNSNNPEDIKVVCGEWDIDSQIESKPKQERTVASISVHPQFNKRQFYHDVALLHLEEDFVLDLHLDVACLPHSPIDGSDNFIPSGCVVTGWGDRAELEASDRKDSAQPIMKAVRNLPIVGHDECQQGFRDQVDQRFRLHESFICAGGERGVDACTGDGGGPLVCPGRFTKRTDVEPSYILAGVVVGGVGCGKEGLAGAYASVEKNLCFIHWATKCQHGEDYRQFYWYPECDNWLEEAKPNFSRRQKAQAEKLENSCIIF